MFKKPVEVNVNTADNVTVNHRVHVAVSPQTLSLISQKVAEIGITVVVATAGVITVKAVADIATHIAKTKIK